MRVTSFATLFLLALCPGHAEPTVSGVWTLNPAKSRFGPTIAPQQFVLRLERTGSHLATWRVTTSRDGKHLVYREYTLQGERRSLTTLTRSRTFSILFPAESTGDARSRELWQVSAKRLVIRRSVNDGQRTVRQRLVLEPSKSGPETSTAGIH